MPKLYGFEFSLEEAGQLIKKLPIFHKKISKTEANILFVDDEEFPIITNLRQSGWNVNLISDIIDLDNEIVKRAHVIFVDYKGVGKLLSPKEEGIGLIKALMKKYSRNKRIILYSGHGNFTLGEHLKVAHNQMAKNSDAYEFITMIESEIKQL